MGLTLRSSGQLPAAAYLGALVPSYSALCRPPLTPALRSSQRFLHRGFGALLGSACVRFVGFQPFRPPAFVQQALPAINLAEKPAEERKSIVDKITSAVAAGATVAEAFSALVGFLNI